MENIIWSLLLVAGLAILALACGAVYRRRNTRCPICDKPGARERRTEFGSCWECENCGSVLMNH